MKILFISILLSSSGCLQRRNTLSINSSKFPSSLIYCKVNYLCWDVCLENTALWTPFAIPKSQQFNFFWKLAVPQHQSLNMSTILGAMHFLFSLRAYATSSLLNIAYNRSVILHIFANSFGFAILSSSKWPGVHSKLTILLPALF